MKKKDKLKEASAVDDFVIILPTHSSYISITKCFLDLLRKNWKNCPFKIIVSVCGDEVDINGVECIYNGKKASLIDCVARASDKVSSKYYISLLGDAFIYKKVNENQIEKLVNAILQEDIEYCCLYPTRPYSKEKRLNSQLRYTNNLDRYSHSFFAFIASDYFIKNELASYSSDLAFEKKYLFQKENYYFDNHLVVKKNYFNLLPGISKGKWDRINYHKLRAYNMNINLDNQIEMGSWKTSIMMHLSVRFKPRSSSDVARKKIKRAVERLFKIEFGVKD